MAGYILKRILRSILSLIVIVFVVMVMVFQLMEKDMVLKKNGDLQHHTDVNDREKYSYEVWETYGYYDMVDYTDYVKEVAEIQGVEYNTLIMQNRLPNTQENDSGLVTEFKELYESKGYTIIRRDKTLKVATNKATCFAIKEINVFSRLWDFFSNLIVIDNTNYVQVSDYYMETYGDIERKIYFSKDEMNGSWCIKGSGTKNRYLLYFDDVFPFIHQNFITLNLGIRYTNNEDFFTDFTMYQGLSEVKETTLPSGITVSNAWNYHERQFNESLTESDAAKFEEDCAKIGDNYTVTTTMYKSGMSMIGYSFVIGVIATILEYIIGVPLGMLLALKKDSIWDKLGNFYIIFIMAVPSLAYIYIFATIGGAMGLPTTWEDKGGASQIPYFILPIISLALPSIANLMKWIRRYTIDQMTSDYVKFARSQGFSEREIFQKHILKNAMIPIVQGIPGAFIMSLTGAIITERVYNVPGMGKLLTDAISDYDNGVIVGLTFFYALLSIVSLIIGDWLMAKVDPRISFGSGGGRK